MDQSTGWFEHRGRRLAYEVHGEGDRVVVYLHGLLIDSHSNRGIADALARRGYRVVLIDLLGHGRSDKPEHASEYRIDAYADQVFALLDELGVDRAVLGGMSLGANVALFAACQRPERVLGLLIEMPVLERAVPSAAMLFVPLLLLVHYGEPVMGALSAALRRLPSTPFDGLNSLLHGASLEPSVMAAVLHGVVTGPVCPTVEQRRQLAVPALVMAHRFDLIHPFDDAVRLAELLPDAVLVRARSPLELRLRPERLTDGIVDFLAEVWADAEHDAGRPGPAVATDERTHDGS